MTDEQAARLRALDRDAVERLMKRCQVGVGGRNALNEAHDIMADCYGTLGRMLLEIDALRRELRVAEARASEAYKATTREIDDEWFKQHDAAMALLREALAALVRGRPQILGVLVQQDQDAAINALRAHLGDPAP